VNMCATSLPVAPAKGRTFGVYGFAAWFCVAAVFEAWRLAKNGGGGEVFCGFIWVEEWGIRASVHLAMALYFLICAVGLLLVRPYAFWMFFLIHVAGLLCEPLWWLWGREVVISHGREPVGLLYFAIGVPWFALAFGWCWIRRANFKSQPTPPGSQPLRQDGGE